MKKSVVTGGAGFIGSTLAEALEARGDTVSIIDNFSTGHERFLERFQGSVHDLDLLDESQKLTEVFADADFIFHLAANADVRYGWNDTRRDLTQNTLATLRVAEAATEAGVRHVVFASTGSIYGEAKKIPTPEDVAFPEQTSLYGASKLGAEGYLAAFAERGSFRVTVFRFVSVLGPRYTHGHVIDFVRQLDEDPSRLSVLGNGKQRKSYMHVHDCVAGVIGLASQERSEPFCVYNLGVPDSCTVTDSVNWITNRLNVRPNVTYGHDQRGWIGDNPFILLDVSKAMREGWMPRYGIQESVEATVDWLVDNRWAFEPGAASR